jgi:hypothetical protein
MEQNGNVLEEIAKRILRGFKKKNTIALRIYFERGDVASWTSDSRSESADSERSELLYCRMFSIRQRLPMIAHLGTCNVEMDPKPSQGIR